MVALKKIFSTERRLTRKSNGPDCEDTASQKPCMDNVRSPVQPKRSSVSPGSPQSPCSLSFGWRGTPEDNWANQFDQIDSHFEHLNQTLDPNAELQHTPATPKNVVGVVPSARHVDLMAAIAPNDHPGDFSSSHAPPRARIYNEDIAERNMTRFLRIQHRSGLTSSRTVSALFQEDVADRNIAKYCKESITLPSPSSQFPAPTPGKVRNLASESRRKRTMGNLNWTSDGDLRATTIFSGSTVDDSSSCSEAKLRQWKSVPSLLSDENVDKSLDSPTQFLGIPPAYKRGQRWSNRPLPDSPTLPLTIDETENRREICRERFFVQRPDSTNGSTSPSISNSLSPSSSGLTGSRRNVRDLSINTELAARGRPKITHRAIQPPTPSAFEDNPAPSIAEIMHSPLPESSPPDPSPGFKVAEMMDLLSKASFSTQEISTHPTYETLQDAIVREINSHDAFKRVSLPVPGPLFTPTPDQEMFDRPPQPTGPGLGRSLSNRSFSKLMRKASFKKPSRSAEDRRSTSISVSSKPHEGLFRRVSLSSSRRRHTDAPPPSSELLVDKNATQDAATVPYLSYMDVLRDASSGKLDSSCPKRSKSLRKLQRQEPTPKTLSVVRVNSKEPITPDSIASVHCLQAQSFSSHSWQNSEAHEESDDDIIHLPSVDVSPPRVQVNAVDENNVRYLIDSSMAPEAHRLINWPRRSNRGKYDSPALAPLDPTQPRGSSPVRTS
ncbi:hypothetical protein POX_d05073 [Penicillium oxalicum]|uniref:hypothetical protein n=1 Tax=Penicillium oxalicum TaxID=69781 RepID=UPI0020B71F63|nr:hypothetical protein POX_d05073 [Penicillium oxalicum]KAI2789579.1 hypothetical protein POX_d05073 [Penicillium oxalicum]